MNAPDDRSIIEALDLVDAAVYADVFGSAVGFAALHRFGRVRVDQETFASALSENHLVVELLERHRSGAFTLRCRSGVANEYPDRVRRAARLRVDARRVARALRHTPFVRGIFLTGSVAAANASADADVDLLIVVADDRVGTAFALLGTASRLVGRRRFCPNFYLAETQLELGPQNVYVGRELAQAEGIVGNSDALREANPWLDSMFPNLGSPEPASLKSGSGLQRLLEAILGGSVGSAIEHHSRRLALSRLRAHYGGVIPVDVTSRLDRGEALRFHASDVEVAVPAVYAERRRELAAALLALSRPDPRGEHELGMGRP